MIKLTRQARTMLEEMYSCETCSLYHFSHDDKVEKKRCYGIGRFNELPVNKDVKEYIERYGLKHVCEYWGPRE